jgi:hypothetical protein
MPEQETTDTAAMHVAEATVSPLLLIQANATRPVASFNLTYEARDFDFDMYIIFRCVLSWVSVLVVLIGLVGNFVSFIVLVSSKMRIATNVFLASLCVSGFIALLGLLLNSVLYDLFAYYQLSDQFQFMYMIHV